MNEPIWDDHPWLGLPTLRESISVDVCVVGLGGSGLSCIVALAEAGLRVAGIDASSVGGGAAGRNGGFLLAGMADFYHTAIRRLGHARALRIYQQTLAEQARIASEHPDLVRPTGSLRIAATPDEERDCHAQLAAMRADQLPVEAYEGPEGRGLLIPTDASFQPLARCRALATRAQTLGAQLYEDTPAVVIDPNYVATPQAQITCGSVVVAVDGGLERIVPELRNRVRSARLQMLATAPTTEIHLPRPVYCRWGWEYWQQLPNGSIVLGGFRDYGGEGEWGAPAIPADPIQRYLAQFLREQLGVQAPIVRQWAAQVGFNETALPIVEQVRPGIWALGAYNGTGNVLGALCGRLVAAQIATGRSPGLADFAA
jgi:glycine/D-amino acid oxidase-like deaminating enzyme